MAHGALTTTDDEDVARRERRLRTWQRDHSRGVVWATGGTLLLAVNAVAAATVALGPSPVHVHVHLHLLPPKPAAGVIPDAASLASGPPLTLPPSTTTTVVAPVRGPQPPGWSGVAPAAGIDGGIGNGGAHGGGGGGAAGPSTPPAGTRPADSDTRTAIATDVPPPGGTTVAYVAVSASDATWALERLAGSPDLYRVLHFDGSTWSVAAIGEPGSLCTGGAPANVQADFSPVAAAC